MDPIHALHAARFASAAVQAAGRTRVSLANPNLGYVQIRVGLHCGPVTGSVIGSLRPKYTLLGDTVCPPRGRSV